MATVTEKPRLVIYGVGQYGGYIARFAVQKGWPVVAAFNRAGPKVGQDLGRVVGLDRDLGVIIQDCDTADYGGLEADIGVVAQTNILKLNLPAYRRLMGAGLNVLCHGSESYYPFGCDPETAEQIDAMARSRGVTFTGGGIWDMSRLWAGILLAGPCTEIKSLYHSSITDAVGQAINEGQARQVGVGMTVEQFLAAGLDKSPIARSYKTIPEHVLVRLGFSVCETQCRIEPVVFEVPVANYWSGGVYEPGLCVGSRIIVDIHTEQGVSATAQIDLRMFCEGEIEHMFWEVDGLPRTRVRTERENSAHATASCLFNRIPDVLAARPGIVTVTEMGPLKTTAAL